MILPMKGKIVKGIAGFYYVSDGVGTVYECKAKGVFRSRGIKPLVGDDVTLEILDERECLGNISEVLPRKSALVRPEVANVDACAVVFAARDPQPSFNLLDRFLAIMDQQDLPVTVCVNKIDLDDDGSSLRAFEKHLKGSGYRILPLCTRTGEGIEDLKEMLMGSTTVFAGPSGVGKSSLINRLLPQVHMETGEISEKIKRGRHTTRHSELFWMAEDTFIFDTPGFSTLWLESFTPDNLRLSFPEYYALEGQCRYDGCMHDREPDCVVKAKVAAGEFSKGRYQNYVTFLEECKNRRKY